MNNKLNLIEELSESGYQVTFLTSFSTDLVFFERMLLRQFEQNECRYIGIYGDKNCIDESLKRRGAIMHLGRSYIMQTVWTTGAFHPKVYLLLGEKKAKVLIGSGNLTTSGFIKNREVFGVFCYDTEHPVPLNLIQRAYEMFKALHQENFSESMKWLFQKADSFSYLHYELPDGPDNNVVMLHNLDAPLDGQMRRLLPSDIQRIEVFAPYFDSSLSVLRRWQTELHPGKITVALQNHTSNYPLDAAIPKNVSLQELAFTNRDERRYHGKVFRFIGSSEEVIVYGSANCSRQAFLEPFTDNGNAEAVVVERRMSGEFDEFFRDEVQVLPISEAFKPAETDDDAPTTILPFRFVNATAYHDHFVMRLVCHGVPSRVVIEGNPGHVTKDGPDIMVTWDIAFPELSQVFDFIVEFGPDLFTGTGWYAHQQALLNFQTNALEHPLLRSAKNDPLLADYDNVLEVLEDMLNRLALTDDDLERQANLRTSSLAVHERSEVNGAVDYSDDPEDYYVTDDWASESYGRLGSKDLIGELVSRLLQPFRVDSNSPAKSDGAATLMPSAMEARSVMSVQISQKLHRQMKEFIDRFRKGITSAAYMVKVPTPVFVKNAHVYSAFLWRIHDIDMSTLPPILETQQLLDELYTLFEAFCTYGTRNVIPVKDLEDLLPQMLSVLMVLDLEADGMDNFQEVRSVHTEISHFLLAVHDHLAPIRTTYDTLLADAMPFVKALGRDNSMTEIAERLERRFSFILFNQLLDRLKLPEGVSLRRNPILEKPFVVVETPIRINTHFRHLQLNLFKQVLAVHEWRNADKYVVSFRNSDPQGGMEKYILAYYRTKNLMTEKCVYRNGVTSVMRKERVYRSDFLAAIERGDIQFLADFK